MVSKGSSKLVWVAIISKKKVNTKRCTTTTGIKSAKGFALISFRFES